MPNNFNVAILGYGLSGSTFHAPIINAVTGLTISHIYARNCHELQNKYPDIVITDDLNDILNDTTINLVISRC